MLYFVTGIVFLPGWVTLARRIGKKHAWLLSIAINTGAFVGVFFLGPGDALIYGVLVFLSGSASAPPWRCPPRSRPTSSITTNCSPANGGRGRYIGLWSIAKKLAAAVGVGAGLSILGLAGYIPNAEQPETVLLALRVLYALVPSVCNLVALAIAFAYPISGAAHQRILEATERRKKGNP